MDESASRKASHAQGRSSHTHPHPHMLFSRRSQQIDKHQQFPDVSHIDDLLAEREFQRRVFSTPSFARSKRKKDELVETLAPDVSVKDARRYYSIERSIPMEDDNRYPDNIWAYDRTAIRVPKDLTTGWTDPAGSTSSENEYSDEAWHPAPSKWSSPYGPSSHKKIVTKAVDESLYINANVLTDGKGSFWVISQVRTDTAFPLAAPIRLTSLRTGTSAERHTHILHGHPHQHRKRQSAVTSNHPFRRSPQPSYLHIIHTIQQHDQFSNPAFARNLLPPQFQEGHQGKWRKREEEVGERNRVKISWKTCHHRATGWI